jgi:hypothetical protein
METWAVAEFGYSPVEGIGIAAGHMQAIAEGRHHVDAGQPEQLFR